MVPFYIYYKKSPAFFSHVLLQRLIFFLKVTFITFFSHFFTCLSLKIYA